MSYPKWLPESYEYAWDHPWEDGKNKANSSRYVALLRKHGYITPHFTWAEASGARRHHLGSDVPASLKANAQRHAWNLEKLRHAIGDRPIPILSWYRNPAHNRAVGGATQSQHMQATATDHGSNLPSSNFDSQADRIFANGGFGRYSSGSRHTDSRGHRARW